MFKKVDLRGTVYSIKYIADQEIVTILPVSISFQSAGYCSNKLFHWAME
jgi:hypothetical protein